MKKPIIYALAAALSIGGSTYPANGQPNPDTPKTPREFRPPFIFRGPWVLPQKLLEERIAEMEQKTEQNPNLDDLIFLTDLYIQNKKLDKAEETAKRAIDIDPNNPITYANLGDIFMAFKQPDKAEEYIRKAYSLDNNVLNKLQLIRVLYAKANDFLSRKNYGDALKNAKEVVELNPNHSSAYVIVGIGHYYKGSLNDAMEAFKKALELNSKSKEARTWLEFIRELLDSMVDA